MEKSNPQEFAYEKVARQVVDVPVSQVADEVNEIFKMSSQYCARQRIVECIVVNPAISISEGIVQASSIQKQEKSIKVLVEFITKTNDVVTHLSYELGILTIGS